jgi:hypothetical protein
VILPLSSYAHTKKTPNLQQHLFPAQSGRKLIRATSLSLTYSVVVCVWGVRGQPGPHGAREKITVIFLHTQIAGKFFVMNQSLSFSLSLLLFLLLLRMYSLLSLQPHISILIVLNKVFSFFLANTFLAFFYVNT